LKKILHIVGNRPQFVKLAVLYKELGTSAAFTQAIIHTGQHFSYEMNELFFKELDIPEPVINFNLQHVSANRFIGIAADSLQEFFSGEKDAIVFVYGDTNTTLAAAIAAKRVNIPLVHFEAGVRTGDNSMPEEINRLLTDRLADINYCCTQKNFDQLVAEGYGSSIHSTPLLTGDLMLDAFVQIETAKAAQATPAEFILSTIHRAANLQNKETLSHIINGLNELHKTTAVIMPVHPHTQKKIMEHGLQTSFITLPPVGYPQMKKLLADCAYVITDSGGTSREAYFMKKRSLIIMEKPFWPEIVEAGCALQTNADDIVKNASLANSLHPDFNTALFGDGNAAKNIHAHLIKYFK
jgi:UDP-GlcNAc3NAcA epimerase